MFDNFNNRILKKFLNYKSHVKDVQDEIQPLHNMSMGCEINLVGPHHTLIGPDM